MTEIGRELSEDWPGSSGSRSDLRSEGASLDNEQKSELKGSSPRSSYQCTVISTARSSIDGCRTHFLPISIACPTVL